jgi:hypothetical protein
MSLKKLLLSFILCLAGLPAFAATGIQTFANNAVTTLASNASSGTTTLTVSSSAAFPSLSGGNWFIATLEHIVSGIVTVNEIVKVTAVSGTSWTVVRAQEGTSGVAWLSGDTVALLPTAGGLGQFVQYQSGTFTGAVTGMSGGFVTGTVNYTVTGNVCTIYVTTAITGTSTSPLMSLTGVPAVCQPANQQYGPCGEVEDNGNLLIAAANISGNTIYFYLATTNAVTNRVAYTPGSFTSSGTKGLPVVFLFVYPLN